eukprot:CAMPEP_0179279094 /NCGR_PEP_ID=MMETSP0797-20121207/35938_1 /TAXON_ID=47934 /ORGANISM="Dinophysis acuminata, Strain DAEP01" /LENGTH=268 /DNA_ID=CAMNT_0020987715 /DNA_START=57 /DNA_END=863 /DNA_ORIENTATION=+
MFHHIACCPMKRATASVERKAAPLPARRTAAHTSPGVVTAPSIRQLPLLDDEMATKLDIKRTEIFEDGSAFVLENVLTAEECNKFIQDAESSGLADCGDEMSFQVADVVTVFSDSVASSLFTRIRPFLKDELDLGSKGVCLDVRARRAHKWNPVNLNDRFQFSRYEAGGFFLPHYDSPHSSWENHCSVQTCLLFLSDHGCDFEGGRTRFYNNQQLRCHPGQSEHVVGTYRPKAGCALVFNHLLSHDVEEVIRGQNFMMKSEVFYTRRK